MQGTPLFFLKYHFHDVRFLELYRTWRYIDLYDLNLSWVFVITKLCMAIAIEELNKIFMLRIVQIQQIFTGNLVNNFKLFLVLFWITNSTCMTFTFGIHEPTTQSNFRGCDSDSCRCVVGFYDDEDENMHAKKWVSLVFIHYMFTYKHSSVAKSIKY